MKTKLKTLLAGLCLMGLLINPERSFAFALLGPFQPWMQASNGVIRPGDIGGPMDIGVGYRWNVPVVTYGFDQSFLNCFGTNGVAAVEGAIEILNNLPPASQIALTNFPFNTLQLNSTAQSQGLYDLKSQTLALLLEQLGLGQPKRSVFVIKQWNEAARQEASNYGISPNQPLGQPNWESWAIPDFIVLRNFSPQSLATSPYLNETLYTAAIYNWNSTSPIMASYMADPFAGENSAVTDGVFSLGRGFSFTGLTYDDVGGLRYLLSTNILNYENILPGVSSAGTNSYVQGAWRPGVDKISFVSHPFDAQSRAFLPTTNYFTDTYFTNGNYFQQQLKRVITQPDFLFTVGDAGKGDISMPRFWRTGTTNWINNAGANGNANDEGPGVIQPPIQIVFDRLGLRCDSSGRFNEDENPGSVVLSWGTFDASTNAPITYPIPQAGTNLMTVRMWLERGTYPTWSTTSFEWNTASVIGSQFIFQTTTNLQTWVNLFTVTNNGTICTYFNNNPVSPKRFYRLIPQ